MRKKCQDKRPLHPFRFIAYGDTSPQSPHLPLKSQTITQKEKNILSLISSGARILFDIKAKRAMVYNFSRGFQALSEITVRFLSSLLRTGQIVRVGQNQNLVHFATIGADPSWYTDHPSDILAQ